MRTRSRRLLALAVLTVGVSAFAACSSDAADEVKETAIEELAIGTWQCEAAPAAGQDPFEMTIDGGTFKATTHDDAYGSKTVTGTWSIGGGDLHIEFSGPAAGAPGMSVDDFDALTLESTELTLKDPGFLTVENEPDGTAAPVDFAVETRGRNAVTLTMGEGDPWTCTRQ